MGKWEMVKLEDVANINMGQSPKSSTYNQIGEGVPFYQGNADFGERYPVRRFWCTVPKKLSAKDDILISVRAPIGAMNFSIETCCIGRGLASITPNPKKLEQKYLWYILKSNYDFLNRQGTGSTFKAINKKILTELLIPLPPLEEQKRIAKNLDLASEIVKGYKKQLAELDKLVQSVFYEMFGDPVTNEKGWAIGTIRDVVREVKYGTSRPATEGGKYPYLRMNNITPSGHLDLSNLKQIDIPDNELEKCMVTYGDVLFNRTNSKELVGKTCVYNLQTRMIIAGYIIRVRVNEKMIPEFLSAILNSKYGKNTLYGMCKSITGQANINAQELQSIKIYVPPIQLQTRFASIVTEIEAQKAQIQQTLTEAENLFNSLMQEYFE